MKFKILIITIISLLKINFAFASHAMGGELTYNCIGNNTYNLTYTFYRDCSGIPAPQSVTIDVTSSCYPTFTVMLNSTPSSPTQISPTCIGALSTCDGGTYRGIQRWVYSGTVTLPGPCSDWTFSRDECCRNSSITTINNPGTFEMHIFSTLNNIGGICNNTPVFTNNPVPFACIGQRFCFNPGAIDPDGDSLVYQLVPPRSSSGIINYNPTYSPTQFILSNPPITFNPLTGDVCMIATQADVSVFTILVSEYRNGVLIGQVERDIQLQVVVCNNIIPLLTGINGVPSFTTTACPGVPCTFWIRSVDPDASDTTRITWDNAIPNATLTTFGGRRDSAIFSWTPSISNLGNTYCFTVTVKDNHCPYIGVQSYSYCIRVDGPQVNAGLDRLIFCGQCTSLQGNGSGGTPPYFYTWDGTINSQSLNPACEGTHIVKIADNNGCVDYDTVNIQIDTNSFVYSMFTIESGCEKIPINITNFSSGFNINVYNWDFGDGTTSNVQNPSTHIYNSSGTYLVKLFVSNSFGCTDSMTAPTIIYPKPTLELNDTAICFGDMIELVPTTNANQFNWLPNNETSNTIFVSPSTPNMYYLTVTNNYGCTNSDSSKVTIYSLPQANFILDTAYYDSENILILDSSYTLNGGIVSWLWSINGTITTDQNPTCIFFNPGYYDINLMVTDNRQCTDTITKQIKINESLEPTIFIPNAFSPNKDNKNDYFKVYGNNLTTVKGEIFDRWGLLIYSWEGIDGFWDGQNCQNDTYLYKIYVEGIKGFKRKFIGKVTLIK